MIAYMMSNVNTLEPLIKKGSAFALPEKVACPPKSKSYQPNEVLSIIC